MLVPPQLLKLNIKIILLYKRNQSKSKSLEKEFATQFQLNVKGTMREAVDISKKGGHFS